jgi:hypothetical protein
MVDAELKLVTQKAKVDFYLLASLSSLIASILASRATRLQDIRKSGAQKAHVSWDIAE